NRAGGSGAIGAQSVVSAPADGHTLLIGQPAEVAINPHWIKGLSYDAERDLQPVALATMVPLALVIPDGAPYATIAEMVKAAAKRSPAAADVPTVAEAASLPDFDIGLWQGVFAPRATPRDVVVRLNAEINRIITQPEITAKLRDDGADVTPLRVDQFSAFVKAESEKYLKIIEQSGVKPE